MKPAVSLVWLVALTLVLPAPAAHAAQPLRAKVGANQMTEFTFVTALKRADPFNEVVLDVLFTEPGGKVVRVPAFWAGGREWKVRFSSPVVGRHTFQTHSSDPRDSGLHGVTGTVKVEPYKGDHPLYKRGRMRVSKDRRYLEHADGTPFLWLGDTWWMGLTKRLSFPDEFNTLAADRKQKGFNVVQIVAGLYPDMPAFDERGFNEAGHPWEKEYAAIRPAYFDEADKRIMRLVEEGFTPCVVGAWGYHLPWLGPEKMKQHQRYVYARWGALPIVWCVAGELNLPFYLNEGFPRGGEKQTEGWEDVIRYCRKINAFERPITAHPTGLPPLSARGVLKDADKLLDFDMLQTPHGQMEALPPTVEAVRFSYNAQPTMPTVNGEPSYEMLLDKTPAEIARMVFWVCWANGVKGYTYGANGIWQLNGADKPYGNSPWGGNYGRISWQEAMHLRGSTQVSLGAQLLAKYPWQRFEPKPEWAAWAPKEQGLDAPVGDWIWFPEGEPATDAPIAARFFRRTIDLSEYAKVTRAQLRITADDRCTVWLNGEEVGTDGSWQTLREFDDIAEKFRPGRNVLAVRAENLKSDVPANPAGLAAGLAIECATGDRVDVRTGEDWRVSQDEAEGWQQPDFDDAAWSNAKTVAPFGGGPWGEVGATPADAYAVPYAMGIPREVRMIYVVQPGAVVVKGLEEGIRYRAIHFDPATGERQDLGPVRRDPAGDWRCDTPPGVAHDWLLVLDTRRN